MEAKAKARFVRVTPQKARRVVDLIRGKQAGEAVAVLKFAPQAAAEPVLKTVHLRGIRRRGSDAQAVPSAGTGSGQPDPQADEPHHRGRR